MIPHVSLPPATAALAVACSTPDAPSELRQLAERLGLPLAQPEQHAQFDYLIERDAQGLCLRKTGPHAPHPVRVDFADYWRQRGEHVGGELLARALRPKGGEPPRVLDATAGLGRDSLLMAALGCQVHMAERVPFIAALLEDALARGQASEDPAVAELCSRMRLYPGDSCRALPAVEVDVVYLDPMFAHKKRGLSKKEMQFFQALVGDDEDSDQLLAPALALARKRVVVKRHAKAPYLDGRKPNFSSEGRAVRFDVYLCPKPTE